MTDPTEHTIGAGRRVRLVTTGGLAELTLAAPPLNLFDGEMIDDVAAALGWLATRPDVRAVLLRAEGRAFCAGMDVREFVGLDAVAGEALIGRLLGLTRAMEALAVPTVAAVHALNLTMGFELALGCDLIWAAEHAQFGLVETTVGLSPGAGGTQRLVARAGVGRATEMVFTGSRYPAAQMYDWGIVNRVLPSAELLPAAREFAGRLASGPTLALAAGKRLIRTARDGGTDAADAIGPATIGPLLATDDLRAGVESLMTRGPGRATFTGR